MTAQILEQIAKIKNEIEDLKLYCVRLRAANEWLRQERDDLKELAYERAPMIAAEQANKQTADLRAEIERLRLEISYIANAQRKSFKDDREFRIWAQNRAQNALNQKPGTFTVKRGDQ
jgi:regulator of replication initiation timing